MASKRPAFQLPFLNFSKDMLPDIPEGSKSTHGNVCSKIRIPVDSACQSLNSSRILVSPRTFWDQEGLGTAPYEYGALAVSHPCQRSRRPKKSIFFLPREISGKKGKPFFRKKENFCRKDLSSWKATGQVLDSWTTTGHIRMPTCR